MSDRERLVPYTQIEFIASEHRADLSMQVRYARFMNGESPEDWGAILGPDVIGLTHPEVTVQLASEFITFNMNAGVVLSDSECDLLITAVWVHDWGEIVIDDQSVGDVSFDQKTRAHEQTERRIVKDLIASIPGEPDIPEKKLIDRAYTEVVQDHDTKLGRMFNIIERLGYLLTAIRAYEGIDGQRIRNWQGLVGNVLSNQIEKLLHCRDEYPYVDILLRQAEDAITQMFEDVYSESVPIDADGNPSYDVERFRQSLSTWRDRQAVYES